MDDLKRSIYMEARRMIEEGECTFVCLALICAAQTTLGMNTLCLDDVEEDEFLEEFFPEFFGLYDGWSWCRVFSQLEGETFKQEKMANQHKAWWSLTMRKARLAILDFIINNR